VAEEAETRGMLEDAVRLHDLAAGHERAVALLNKLLAQVCIFRILLHFLH